MTGRGSVTPGMACGSRPVEAARSSGPSRQSAKTRARDCQGGGLFPLGPPPFTAGGQIASVGKAEPDKQMAAISADRQSVIADKRRNGRYRSRTRTVARITDRVEAKPGQPKDLLFRRLLTSKET